MRGLRDAYEHRGGIKTLRLGRLTPAWFAEIQKEASLIIDAGSASDVTARNHVTNWTRPRGQVSQYSLFNSSGRSDDTSGDYGYRGDVSKKKFVFPQLTALKRFTALFGDSLRNLRLNGMGTQSGLSAHEENSISAHALGTDHIVRFHLPIFTNSEAYIHLDDERFQYREGELYFFHHGCVHAAANLGTEARYHLVFDCFLDRALFQRVFPGTPSPDADFHKASPDETALKSVPFVFPEFVCEDGRVIKEGIRYGRQAPTALHFYRKNYPSVFKWLPQTPAAHSAQA